jgi:hypothetical protein
LLSFWWRFLFFSKLLPQKLFSHYERLRSLFSWNMTLALMWRMEILDFMSYLSVLKSF